MDSRYRARNHRSSNRKFIFAAAAMMALSSCANLQTRDTVAGGARRASDFVLTSDTGKTVRLEGLRKQGHVVVVFYRGFW